MRSQVLFLLLGVITLSVLYVVIQRRQTGASPFETPREVKTVSLGGDPRNRVTCLYFPGFMVKEVDKDSKGAEQISVIPVASSQTPPCQQADLPSEIVIDPTGWSGYVEGIKSRYLFLSGDDGFGLLFPFAVFDVRTGTKLFDDAITLKDPFESVEIKGSGLTMKYMRAVQLECSLLRDPKNDGAACWEKARKELRLDMPMPDCSEPYRKDAPGAPEDPSDIAYDVRAEWDGHQLKVTPVGHSAICGPRP
jgi:hypothetical protein